MAKAVFEFRDYKSYLLDRIEEKGRGEKSRLAEALHCHTAYISQILRGSAEVSFEQADGLNQYFAHSESEGDFFLLLVSQARAGTPSLRKHYATKIERVLVERTLLANRLKDVKTLPEENRATYYSAWYYAAIYILISIPEFRSKEALARRLRLSQKRITMVLDFLVRTGLARFEHGQYVTGETQIFVPADSPWTPRHHASWRMQAISSLEREAPEELHYTGVVSIAESDVPEVRRILVDTIEAVRAVVRKSPEEAAYCYALDFFEV